MDMESVINMLDEISEDRTVPRNVRTMVQEAKDILNDTRHDMAVRISGAISILDDVSNDQNIPVYTRTHVWNIVSMLEAMNKGLKK